MFGTTSSGPECPATPLQVGFKFRVSQRVQNGVEFSRFDGSVFSLNVLECHLANALHPRSLFLWTLGKNRPKEWKIRGIASSVSTAAHLNTVPKSPVPTSRLPLPTCTPPTMSRLFLLMRSQDANHASRNHQPVALILPNPPELAADIWPMAKTISIIHHICKKKKHNKKFAKRTICQKRNGPE